MGRARLIAGVLALAPYPALAIADPYPVSGVWAYFDPGDPSTGQQACGHYRDSASPPRQYAVFEGNRRKDLGAHCPAGCVSINLAVRSLGNRRFQIKERSPAGDPDQRAGSWREDTYVIEVIDTRTIDMIVEGETFRYSKCTAETPPQKTTPNKLASADTTGELWNHNGSVVSIAHDLASRKITISYVLPRPALEQLGVAPSTLLFSGRRIGSKIAGSALAFKRGCSPVSYKVAGTITADNERIELRGHPPMFDPAGCDVDAQGDSHGSTSVLVFVKGIIAQSERPSARPENPGSPSTLVANEAAAQPPSPPREDPSPAPAFSETTTAVGTSSAFSAPDPPSQSTGSIDTATEVQKIPDLTEQQKQCKHAINEEAIGACGDLIASGMFSGSDLASVYTSRGEAYAGAGEYDHALDDFGQALRLAPGSTQAYRSRGLVFEKRAQWDDAVSDLEAASKISPARSDIQEAIRQVESERESAQKPAGGETEPPPGPTAQAPLSEIPTSAAPSMQSLTHLAELFLAGPAIVMASIGGLIIFSFVLLAARMRGRNVLVDAPSGTRFTESQWAELLSSDQDVARIAGKLKLLGDPWLDRFAQAYLAAGDKAALPNVLRKIIDDARGGGLK